MEVPAPSGGKVEKLLIKLGDKVQEGTPILLLRSGDGALTPPPSLLPQQEPPPATQPSQAAAMPPATPAPRPAPAAAFRDVHASPAVPRIARKLAADLTKVKRTLHTDLITN